MVLENIIKDIIEADRDARERVLQAETENGKISEVLQQQRVAITKEFEQAASQKKDAYKAELEAQLQQHQLESDQEYEKILHDLQRKFQKESDSWVDEIVHRCLER